MEQEFIDLENKWMNAWKHKDESTVRELVADEFTLTSSLSTGDLINKETWVDKAIHSYHCQDFQINHLQVRVYGSAAVLNIWFRQTASANGNDWSGDFLLTDVSVEKENGWQVVSRHSSWLKK